MSIITANLRSEKVIKLDYIYTQLIDETRRIKSNKGDTEMSMLTDSIRPPSHNKPKKPKCDHCGKKGHIEEDCWEKYPEKARTRNPTSKNSSKNKTTKPKNSKSKKDKKKAIVANTTEED